MTQEGELARSAVEQDLFGPGALHDEPAPPAPEKYELRRRLGSGGAGVVYLAEDTSLKRAVALKFLHDASEADVERFRREARFTARLNDPAIVQVYETGDVYDSPLGGCKVWVTVMLTPAITAPAPLLPVTV